MSGLSTRENRTATKQELRAEIEQLRWVGSQMANVCFNWSQRKGVQLTASDCKMLGEMQTEWDSIKRSERA